VCCAGVLSASVQSVGTSGGGCDAAAQTPAPGCRQNTGHVDGWMTMTDSCCCCCSRHDADDGDDDADDI